jgi:formylglycine-generating enzyme required for sulfatase activity
MMKRDHIFTTFLSLACVLAVACGGGGDPEEPGPAKQAAADGGQASTKAAAPGTKAAAQIEPPKPPPEPVRRTPPTTLTPPPKREGMVYIPAGEFLMGSAPDDTMVYPWEKPHEQPQHPVYLDAYYIDTHEVTNEKFETFKPGRKVHERSPCPTCPRVRGTWHEAVGYCGSLGKRLPTEAEWERAAKGGGKHVAVYRNSVWYAENSIDQAQPVGVKAPNDFGLYDMLGNVREWTADWYGPGYYRQRVYDNPKGPSEGVRRVERGGAFFLPRRGVTPTIRYNHPPHFRLYFLGFRCAQDP